MTDLRSLPPEELDARLAACAHPSLLRMAMGFVAREALGTQAE